MKVSKTLKIRKTMPASRPRTSIRAVLLLFALFSFFLACPGCGGVSGYLGFWGKQRGLKKEFQQEPSAEILRDLQPEDCYLLVGRVALNRDHRGPILVVAVTDKFREREIVVSNIMQTPVNITEPTFRKATTTFISLPTWMETVISTPTK